MVCSSGSRAPSPGSIPVIRVLQESLAGAPVERVHGIVNGTTNFILTEMARTGSTFEETLAEAQRLGYAEADPSEDVDGRDAAAKMAILARLAFGTPGPRRIRFATRGSSTSSPMTWSTRASWDWS